MNSGLIDGGGGNTYKGSGVDYDAMDPFKREAQLAGRQTADAIERFGFREVPESRGESVYLIETPWGYIALVEEGLGTKNRAADRMRELTGKSYYHHIAQDTVAMNVNDMITLGALPLTTAMHLAVGDSNWFNDKERSSDLIRGWKDACKLAGCTWGGGETPTLKGVVVPGASVLSVSATGIIMPKERRIMGNIAHGDAIIFIASSGIHANGLTLARKIADDVLPKGYLTELPGGRTYGETLLDPTEIYVSLIEECLNAGMAIHYTVNITGHGWRKLMRFPCDFDYVIDCLPPQLPIFAFLQEYGRVSDEEAYGNLNMGAGFALYVPETEAHRVIAMAKQLGYTALIAGYIERSHKKRVVIRPNNLVFGGETLGVR